MSGSARRKDIQPRPRSPGEWRWLAIILLIAALARAWQLGAKSLWLDEVMTVRNAAGSYAWMIGELKKFDAHPPAYQTIEWLWLRLGSGDGFARVPSVVAGIAGVWLTWLVARRLMGRRVGLAAALLMALSQFHIYYSQEARLFALVIAIFLGQVYLLLRLIEGRGRAGWKWWTAYGALGLLSLYTYALCILTLGALGVAYLALSRRGRREWTQFIIVHLLIAVLFLPWVPVMTEITGRVKAMVMQRGDDFGRPGPDELALSWTSWAFGPPRWPERPAFGATHWQENRTVGCALGVAAVLIAALSLARRRTARPAKFLLVLFVLPIAGYLILPMPRVQQYDPKHLCFLQPLLIIGMASLAGAALTKRRIPPLAIILAPVVLLNVLGLWRYFSPQYQKEAWPRLVADVQKIQPPLGPDDGIIFSPGYIAFAFEHYAAGTDIHEIASNTIVKVQDPRDGSWRLVVRPDIRRLWLIECRDPAAFLDPDPERDEKARQEFIEGYVSGTRMDNWLRRTQTRFAQLGYVRYTLFMPTDPAPAELAP